MHPNCLQRRRTSQKKQVSSLSGDYKASIFSDALYTLCAECCERVACRRLRYLCVWRDSDLASDARSCIRLIFRAFKRFLLIPLPIVRQPNLADFFSITVRSPLCACCISLPLPWLRGSHCTFYADRTAFPGRIPFTFATHLMLFTSPRWTVPGPVCRPTIALLTDHHSEWQI